MYKTADLPAKWANAPAAWAVHHPPPEYQYMLWTDESLRELITTDYPWLLPTYDAYPYPTQRWDASRYAVLHKYGGLYADLDLHPAASVAPLLRGQTLILPYTPNIGLTNAVMAATKGHAFLEFVLRGLPQYAHAWYHVSKHNTVLSSTGSTYIWARYMTWSREHPEPTSAAGLLPPEDWGKCSYCDRRRATLDKPPSPQANAGAEVDGQHAGVPEGGAAPQEESLMPHRLNSLAAPQETSAASESAASASVWSAAEQMPPWQSPFKHLQGSSWHSGDSELQLFLFCHVNELALLVVFVLVWQCTRDRDHRWRPRLAVLGWIAALVTLVLLAQRGMRQYFGEVLLRNPISEALIGRPWIWLIMS
uniref:Alpha 1,4-glycosyltransferase domain-containing protein n=2 Tax=Haptolina brevifila TaxID=156173 RepID=A0A7S2GXA6_9EUKA|mmetsp:Transcript_48620/g.97005  ORF Transcript_48620/g.97005 Transcript_48620/m.97005 type:complete len:364 (+) Transcript_48620:89-1180(+)